MNPTRRGRTAAAALAAWLLAGLAPARAGDWPMLGRDGTRNAVSQEKHPPVRWQTEESDNGFLVRPSWNLKWEARLGSSAFAPPVVSGGLVWVGTNNHEPRDPKVTKDAAVLMCFRESDGKFLWQYVSPRLARSEHQDWPHSGINCSPLAEGDRLTFTTNRCELVCLDVGPLRAGKGTPRVLWKLDMRKQLGVSPVGAAMGVGLTCSVGSSYKGRLYVTTGNGVDEDRLRVPAPQAPSLLCLDRDTGKVLWSDNSPGKNILDVQWSSPLVIEVKGRGQVIAAQGDGWVRSFDALSGKLIWKFDTNPKDAVRKGRHGTRNYLLATPVYHEGRVYIANGRSPVDSGSGPGRLYCIDPDREGDVSPELDAGPGKGKPNSNSAAVWCFAGKGDKAEEQMGRTISTVAIDRGLVIAPVLDGYVHCLDAKTGRRYWTHDAQASITGSPLIADGKVYVGDHDGNVTVLARSREKKVLAVNENEGTIYSSPVFANGVLYVATSSGLFALKAGGASGKVTDRAPGHWPQWRGPRRDNVSPETGLLKAWPKEGPPLAWKARGLGEGVASVAVAGGRVYTLGQRGGHEFLTALEEATGKPVWSVPVGAAVKENPVMRWLCQRAPVVEERVYAATARGDVVCLRVADGKEVWRKNYAQDFAGRRAPWGFGDRPLVDGERLICVPGGASATVVALNKRTGAVVWKCGLAEGDTPEYGATVVSEAGGVRHYVMVLRGGLAGVAARDGKLLWRYEKSGQGSHNCNSAIVSGNRVFCGLGYGRGFALLEMTAVVGGGVKAQERYFLRKSLPNWHETTTLVGGHVYASANNATVCIELTTGKVVWEKRTEVGGNVSVACADSHLYLRSQRGKVLLIEASPKGTLQIPDAQPKLGATAPVVAGGRLYLRDDDVLFCYDVKEGATPRRPGETVVPPGTGTGKLPRPRREADAVFVPTPQDVVEKMLELAAVKKTDLLCDLGCGDGRIVVTAARKYGCKTIGYDIDPQCVRMSQENVRKHDVGRLVRIERKDIFTLDLGTMDVVALYLLPRMNERLLPQLAKLKAGARVVCHANAIPGIRPERVVMVASREDDVPHKVYLYVAPLKKDDRPK